MGIDDTEMHISDNFTCEQFADAVRRELDQAEIPKWDLYPWKKPFMVYIFVV